MRGLLLKAFVLESQVVVTTNFSGKSNAAAVTFWTDF